MTTTHKLIWMILLIGVYLALRIYLSPFLSGRSVKAASKFRRKVLLNTMKSRRRPPKLCIAHIKGLKIGQIALIGDSHCDQCYKVEHMTKL